MSDPGTLVAELDTLVSRLDRASKELYTKQKAFDEVEELYEDAFNDLLTALIEDYEEQGKRPPGEEKCKALVVKQMRQQEPILFGDYRRKRSELRRENGLAKNIKDAISARQSQLSYLKVEASAIG